MLLLVSAMVSSAAISAGLTPDPKAISAPAGRRAGTWSKDYAVVKTSTAAAAGQLPDLLCTLWPDDFQTASAARRACRRSIVLVDGSVGRNGCGVCAGAQLELLARVSAPELGDHGRRGAPPATAEPLRVVLDDPSFALVFKPAGMPTAGGEGLSMRELLASSMSCSGAPEGEAPLWRPQHVHRLDAATSGLLVVAKTRPALSALSASFAERRVHKTYRVTARTLIDRSSERAMHRSIDRDYIYVYLYIYKIHIHIYIYIYIYISTQMHHSLTRLLAFSCSDTPYSHGE